MSVHSSCTGLILDAGVKVDCLIAGVGVGVGVGAGFDVGLDNFFIIKSPPFSPIFLSTCSVPDFKAFLAIGLTIVLAVADVIFFLDLKILSTKNPDPLCL